MLKNITQNLNKWLGGAKSFAATLSLVAGWVVTFSNILPPRVVVWAQFVLGGLTLLHAVKSQYGSEFKALISTVEPPQQP